jgi:hypothetical protein
MPAVLGTICHYERACNIRQVDVYICGKLTLNMTGVPRIAALLALYLGFLPPNNGKMTLTVDPFISSSILPRLSS